MALKLFLLLGILFLSQATGKDVTCKKGKVNTKITINSGDTFSFSTSGKQYAAKQNCKAMYKLGSCKKASLSCSKFQTVVTSKCKRGDRVQVKIGKTALKRFCGKDGPKMDITSKFYLQFISDSKKSSKGFSCTVQCQDEPTTVKPTTTTPGGSGSNDCKCGLASRQTRIVGGTVTEVNEYPWQVGLVGSGGSRPFCGGSVIGDRWVLTAAHCTGSSSIQVLLGEHDTSSSNDNVVRKNVVRVIDHPSYDRSTLDYDFSLLQLDSAIDFASNEHIRPVCLPSDDSNTYAGQQATVTGWGTTSSGGSTSSTLREVVVQVLTNTECTNKGYTTSDITANMICAGVEAGGKDSCQGDSGGPLVSSGSGDGVTAGQNYEQIGVVSWGYGCAVARYPGVYARTSKVISWINSNTSGSFNTCPRT